MTILGLLSIQHISASGSALTGLIFSDMIGNNLGPHFFPLGSLAIVIWLETMKRKGVDISLKEYPQSRRSPIYCTGRHCFGGALG